jgi:hypothetical protein
MRMHFVLVHTLLGGPGVDKVNALFPFPLHCHVLVVLSGTRMHCNLVIFNLWFMLSRARRSTLHFFGDVNLSVSAAIVRVR